MTTQHRCILYVLATCIFVFSPTRASDPTPPRVLHISSKVPIIGTFDVKVFQSLELFYQRAPMAMIRASVTSETMTLTLPHLPDGRYLISISHDANNDGRLNANAFGVPTESSAFYRPGPDAGPVRPRDAFFNLTDDQRQLEARLDPPPADPRAWGVGALLLLSSNPYRGGDAVVRVFPAITYVGERLFVVGPRAGYNVFRNRLFNANLIAEAKFAGEAFDEQRFLEGMTKRRDTAMAGCEGSLRAGPWRLEGSIFTDVLDRHNGQEISLSLSRSYRHARWSLAPGAGLVWRSPDYNTYYFGVRANEATQERPAYKPHGSVEPFVRLFGRFEINGSWSFLGSVGIEALSEEVRDSPIVDKDLLTSAFIGINYAF